MGVVARIRATFGAPLLREDPGGLSGEESDRGGGVLGILRILRAPLRRRLRPDTVEYGAGTGQATDVLAWVNDPGALTWTFTTAWKTGDRPLAQAQVSPQTASTAVVRVTEDAAKLPDIGVPVEASTLVITATADGWDPLQRYLRVLVSREGLFSTPSDVTRTALITSTPVAPANLAPSTSACTPGTPRVASRSTPSVPRRSSGHRAASRAPPATPRSASPSSAANSPGCARPTSRRRRTNC